MKATWFAKRLIGLAKQGGANAAKFQLRLIALLEHSPAY